MTDLPNELISALSQGLSQFGVNLPPMPGSLPGKPLPDGTPGPSLYCAVIVKRVDAQTRAKTGINELLRD